MTATSLRRGRRVLGDGRGSGPVLFGVRREHRALGLRTWEHEEAEHRAGADGDQTGRVSPLVTLEERLLRCGSDLLLS
jgi:hypothetical protein